MSYSLIKQFNPQHAHIKFKGPFQGQTVNWDTQLFTLQEYANQENKKSGTIRQFIDIQPSDENTLKLVVALNVAVINKPTIEKAMIMIKQFKKLAFGRHEYGEVINLNQSKEN